MVSILEFMAPVPKMNFEQTFIMTPACELVPLLIAVLNSFLQKYFSPFCRTEPEWTPNEPRADPERTPNGPRTDRH